jgi:plastocyanin
MKRLLSLTVGVVVVSAVACGGGSAAPAQQNDAAADLATRIAVRAEATAVPQLIEPFEGQTVELTIQGYAYQPKEITVKSGGKMRVRLNNKDRAGHNIEFRLSRTDATLVAPGSMSAMVINGIVDVAFDIPPPGTYYFRCSPHDAMFGGLIVTP